MHQNCRLYRIDIWDFGGIGPSELGAQVPTVLLLAGMDLNVSAQPDLEL